MNALRASLICTCVLMAGFFTYLLMAAGDDSQWGWLGGIIGGVLGTVLGVFGTYCSIRNMKTTTERPFMICYAIAIWLAVIVLIWLPISLSLFGVIPVWLQWASFVLFALFFVQFVPSIGWANWRAGAYLASSACFFVVYALEDKHSLFTLAAGLTMLVIGAVPLIGATVKRST